MSSFFIYTQAHQWTSIFRVSSKITIKSQPRVAYELLLIRIKARILKVGYTLICLQNAPATFGTLPSPYFPIFKIKFQGM